MSEIKTITVTSTEQEITLDATYQFMWFRNMGDNDCYVSDHSGIIAGADDVALCKAGECVRITLPQAPMSNKAYIKAVDGSNTVEIHAQNFSDKPTAKTGKGSGGGQSITVEPLTVTENGVYTAPTGKAYSPVSVDVQEQPWTPLQDGYSNFWFELDNNALSPWLNFSAKTENAVIDWGDGSGEVALDTLTPTHTYSKAGRYVVKVKGITGIAAQHTTVTATTYYNVLKAIELNSEVTSINNNGFRYCLRLENVSIENDAIVFTNGYTFQYCVSLKQCIFKNNSTISLANGVFSYCFSLKNIINMPKTNIVGLYCFNFCPSMTSITLPNTVNKIENLCFANSTALSEIHCQATTPPILGSNVFQGLPANYIIYVPVGYGETYKAAEGWSAYAVHILEEGQTPNRMMLAKFNSDNTDNEEMR